MIPIIKRDAKNSRKSSLPLVSAILTCVGFGLLVKSLVRRQNIHSTGQENKSSETHDDMAKTCAIRENHRDPPKPQTKPDPASGHSIQVVMAILQTIIFGIMIWTNCIYLGHLKQYTRAADASEKQAAAAQDQLREMRAERELDERAWVAEFELEPIWSDTHESVIFDVHYKNTGRTPAINTQFVTSYTPVIEQIPQHDSIPVPPMNRGLIPPSGIGRSHTDLVPGLVMQKVAKGTPFFLYGTVWYDDIFGRHHWTQFGVRIERGLVDPALIQYSVLPIHNSCDGQGDQN